MKRLTESLSGLKDILQVGNFPALQAVIRIFLLFPYPFHITSRGTFFPGGGNALSSAARSSSFNLIS